MAYDHRDRGDRDHHNFSTTVYQHQHGFEGRKAKRPTTDYGNSVVQWIKHRRRNGTTMEAERPKASYIIDMLPPPSRVARPSDSIPSKHMHSSLNKIKFAVNVVKWTPDGRRLLTGSASGEFTLWNGMGFNFETIMSAHEKSIRALAWSHSDDWLISADDGGVVKYWQPNFNNVKEMKAHEGAIRGLAFAPTDTKYATGSDDSKVKLWDFASGQEESMLSGHGWDVKALDWHPSKGLLASGSRDNQIKLWDPRTSRCLTTLNQKNAITKLLFDTHRGDMLATAARNTGARIFDLRMMRDVLLLKRHEKEIAPPHKPNDKDVLALAWHPIHHSLFTIGTQDGTMQHYLLDEPNLPENSIPTRSPYDSPDPSNAPAQTIWPAHYIPYAHENAVYSLDWHPLGHILASGSNDRVTRFWSRARPGETECFNDRYHIGDAAAKAHGHFSSTKSRRYDRDEDVGDDDEDEALVDQKMPPKMPGLPGIAAALPGMTAAPPQGTMPPPLIPGMPPQLPPGMDPSLLQNPAELQKFLAGAGVPPPPPGFNFGANANGAGPPLPFMPTSVEGGVVSGRQRAPLPSQAESLAAEQSRGNFRNIR